MAKKPASKKSIVDALSPEMREYFATHTGLEHVQEILNGTFKVPFHEKLNLHFTQAAHGLLVATVEPNLEEMANSYGLGHGGFISGVCLAVSAYAVTTLNPKGQFNVGTSIENMSIRSPITRDTKSLTVIGRDSGYQEGNLRFADVEMYDQNNVLVAEGRSHQIIISL